jgi:alpha-amylase
VTQEYAGAADLDIPPADSAASVTVCRIWCAAGKPIQGSLYFDSTGWTPTTRLVLELFGPSGTRLASGTYTPSATQGTAISATAGAVGWYSFRIRAADTPPANRKPAYWLKTTYTAPLKLQ